MKDKNGDNNSDDGGLGSEVSEGWFKVPQTSYWDESYDILSEEYGFSSTEPQEFFVVKNRQVVLSENFD